jgi:hypothetical protein
MKKIITDVKTLTGATTIVEVFKKAIALYVLVHRESKDGSKLVIHKKDGSNETIILL